MAPAVLPVLALMMLGPTDDTPASKPFPTLKACNAYVTTWLKRHPKGVAICAVMVDAAGVDHAPAPPVNLHRPNV